MDSTEAGPPGHSAAYRSPAVWLATGLGVGWMRVAPGTFGSLLGLPLGWGLSYFPEWWQQAAALAVVAAAGIPICAGALRVLGGPHDPGWIVFDEIVGMAATLLFGNCTGISSLVLGFLLFRLFDVTKPPPVKQVEHLPGAWGVMGDDLVAALYANLSLRGVMWVAAWLFQS